MFLPIKSHPSRSSPRRRRRQPRRLTAFESQKFQALFSLLSVLLILTLLEVFFIHNVFLGPGGSMTDIKLSDQDFFISDTGAIEQSAYLQSKKASSSSVSADSSLNIAQKLEESSDSYGKAAVIIGLETCEQYLNTPKTDVDFSIAVIGLFQRRTSNFEQLMRKNCHAGHARSDIFYNSQSYMDHFPMTNLPEATLPVVLMQDPLSWIIDVCRDRPSSLKLDSASNTQECLENQESSVRMQNPEFHNETQYASLTQLYNEWYSPWFSKQQKGPRLVIRSEDLVLYPEKVVTEVCRCLGGSIGDHFRNKAPSHLEHSVKRGLELYSKGTLEAISKVLDREISDVMGYGITERQ